MGGRFFEDMQPKAHENLWMYILSGMEMNQVLHKCSWNNNLARSKRKINAEI